MTYLDTNVIIDLLDDASERFERCLELFEEAKARGRVFLSDIVYSETSIGFDTQDALDEVIANLGLSRSPISDDGLFAAGRAFKKYKEETDGPKNNVLPDFFIGAQAKADNMPLITSDAKRMVGYFEGLEVLKP